MGPLFCFRRKRAASAAGPFPPPHRPGNLPWFRRRNDRHLGCVAISPKKRLDLHTFRTSDYLLLDCYGCRVAAVRIWPFRAILSNNLQAALFLHDSKPGKVSSYSHVLGHFSFCLRGSWPAS